MKRHTDQSSHSIGKKLVPSAPVTVDYLTEEVRTILHHGFNSAGEGCYERTGASYHSEPFSHCVLPDFIEDAEFIDKLEGELQKLKQTAKSNDLYKFRQTKDLRSVSTECLRQFRELLYGEFRQWLIKFTEIELDDTVDISCSRYQHTDVLLCHDDELEHRRIAFIYYLVPDWDEADGGSLDLFNKDDNEQPGEIVKRIFPKRNNFVFFTVSETSFHQVAEVLSVSKTRLSINGWFYGPPLKRKPSYKEPPLKLLPHISIEEDIFYDWLNPLYLDEQVQREIKEKFQNESEIELQNFIKTEKYESLCKLVEDTGFDWQEVGPANRRCYYKLNDHNLPDLLQSCLTFMRSDALFLMLSNMTGLKLHSMAQVSDSESDQEETTSNVKSDSPTCFCEVRRWQHSCYTLVHDCDTTQAEYALDTTFYIGCQDWKTDYGGYTSYIARGEDEELLTVNPTENSLALVYKDKETLKFVKHINNHINKMTKAKFYDISTIFYE